MFHSVTGIQLKLGDLWALEPGLLLAAIVRLPVHCLFQLD